MPAPLIMLCLVCDHEFAAPNDTTPCPHCKGFELEILDDSEESWDGFNSDAEADADVLRSAGWGTDEDYGHYGDDYHDEMGDSF